MPCRGGRTPKSCQASRHYTLLCVLYSLRSFSRVTPIPAMPRTCQRPMPRLRQSQHSRTLSTSWPTIPASAGRPVAVAEAENFGKGTHLSIDLPFSLFLFLSSPAARAPAPLSNAGVCATARRLRRCMLPAAFYPMALHEAAWTVEDTAPTESVSQPISLDH